MRDLCIRNVFLVSPPVLQSRNTTNGSDYLTGLLGKQKEDDRK
jgi:hypothetical protein